VEVGLYSSATGIIMLGRWQYMSNFFAAVNKAGEKLETPFLIRHIEGHLVFGPLSRYFPLGYVVLVAVVVSLFVGLFVDHQTIRQYIGVIIDNLIFLILPFIFLPMTRRQQAIVGWLAAKYHLVSQPLCLLR
jgi:hypothetical protein